MITKIEIVYKCKREGAHVAEVSFKGQKRPFIFSNNNPDGSYWQFHNTWRTAPKMTPAEESVLIECLKKGEGYEGYDPDLVCSDPMCSFSGHVIDREG